VKCREVTSLLAEYLHAELPPDERSRLEEHLGGCAECLVYLHGYRETVRTVRANRFHAVPAMPEDLVQAILRAPGCIHVNE
jgi:anti-sigma factor RsiW